METERCPGCYAQLVPVDGPTHRYIGASAACWDLYTRMLAGDPPLTPGARVSLLVDAYAAQHPGGSSPQATQSAAIHLVVLEAVLARRFPIEHVVDLRVAAVEVGRERGGYPKLDPVPSTWEITIGDVASPHDVTERSSRFGRYVESVWRGWVDLHGDEVADWCSIAVERL